MPGNPLHMVRECKGAALSILALGEGKTLGLAIYRMRAGDPTPETRSNGHAKACKCDECERCRYTEGWG